jgi:hypothetical protein
MPDARRTFITKDGIRQAREPRASGFEMDRAINVGGDLWDVAPSAPSRADWF